MIKETSEYPCAIVMEYIDRKTLDEGLKRVGKINDIDTLKYSIELAKGMLAVNRANSSLVHMDLSSKNIMLTNYNSQTDKYEELKIIDFGVSD